MAYNESNVHLLMSGVSGGPNLWVFRDTVAHGDADAANYIETGVKFGMKVGDIVIYQDSDTNYNSTLHSVQSVSGDAVTLSAAIFT